MEEASEQFKSKVEQNSGKEYIHYDFAHSKFTHFQLEQSLLKSIMNNNMTKFTNRFNVYNNIAGTNSEMSFKEVKEILDLFNGGKENGIIGNAFVQTLNEISGSGQDGANAPSRYGTSGGTTIEGSLGESEDFEVLLSTAKTFLNNNVKKGNFTNFIDSFTTSIDTNVNNIINFIAENNKSIAIAEIWKKIQKSERGKTPSVSELITSTPPPNGSHFTEIQAAEGMEHMVELLTEVKKFQDELKNISAHRNQRISEDKEGAEKIISQLKGIFNDIGGTSHELAVVWAFLAAATEIEEVYQKSEKDIENMVARFKDVVYTGRGNTVTLDNGLIIEKKNDVEITMSYGKGDRNFDVSFGGNIKLRHSEPWRTGTGSGSQTLPISGLVARTKNFRTGLEDIQKLSGAPNTLVDYALAVIGSKKDKSGYEENIIANWHHIRNLVGAEQFVDAISGLGESGDFSGVFIVNNKIISIADMLETLARDDVIDSQWENFGKNYFEVYGIGYERLNDEVLNGTGNTSDMSEAISRNKNAYRILESAKVHITVNLKRFLDIQLT